MGSAARRAPAAQQHPCAPAQRLPTLAWAAAAARPRPPAPPSRRSRRRLHRRHSAPPPPRRPPRPPAAHAPAPARTRSGARARPQRPGPRPRRAAPAGRPRRRPLAAPPRRAARRPRTRRRRRRLARRPAAAASRQPRLPMRPAAALARPRAARALRQSGLLQRLRQALRCSSAETDRSAAGMAGVAGVPACCAGDLSPTARACAINTLVRNPHVLFFQSDQPARCGLLAHSRQGPAQACTLSARLTGSSRFTAHGPPRQLPARQKRHGPRLRRALPAAVRRSRVRARGRGRPARRELALLRRGGRAVRRRGGPIGAVCRRSCWRDRLRGRARRGRRGRRRRG